MEKVPPKQKKNKGASREELLKLDKSDLVDKIVQLEAHNKQLKNIINKNVPDVSQSDKREGKKPFDFDKCHFRRILLRVLYFGWDYQGLAVQEDTTQTIEHHLFHALTKSCLIQSREVSQYHRCGRTDKGVSAFGQVISITLRSRHSPEQQFLEDSIVTEMPYCKILNRLLPKEIRAVAWMPIPDDKPGYSARFDCKKRQYKYYFPRSSLDIAAMRQACSFVIGSHDFRHLCKMDVGNGVTEFRREIIRADVFAVDDKECNNPTSMYCLVLEGNAFLWHQIRCIMGVLLLVGQGKEKSEVVKELLDVKQNPRKPQYNMALDIPLNLFHCSYELEDLNNWVYDRDELRCLIAHVQSEWTIHSVKTTMIKDCLHELEAQYSKLLQKREINTQYLKSERNNMVSENDKNDMEKCEGERDSIMAHADCLLQGVKAKVYTPLLKRETCSSLGERIEYYTKKRKLNEVVGEKDIVAVNSTD